MTKNVLINKLYNFTKLISKFKASSINVALMISMILYFNSVDDVKAAVVTISGDTTQTIDVIGIATERDAVEYVADGIEYTINPLVTVSSYSSGGFGIKIQQQANSTTINNGIIIGKTEAIYINDISSGTTTLTNNGTITATGSIAILVQNSSVNIINNSGTINGWIYLVSTSRGTALTLNSSGTINGDLLMTPSVGVNSITLTNSTTSLSGKLFISSNSAAAEAILDMGLNTLAINTAAGSSFNADSTLKVSVNGTSNGLITTAGGGNLILADGATIDANVTGDPSNGYVSTIIQNTSAVANADPENNLTFIENSAMFDGVLSNSGFNTVITWTQLGSNQVAITPTVTVVYDQINDAFANDSALLTELNNLNLADLDAALKSLSPEVSGGAMVVSNNILASSINTIENHQLAITSGEEIASNGYSGISAGNSIKGFSPWGEVFGANAKQGIRKGVSGYDAITSGLIFGVDTNIAEGLNVGLAFNYSYTRIDSDSSDTEIDGHQFTAYGSKTLPKDFFVNGSISYAMNNYEASRYITAGTIKRVANSEYSGGQYSTKVEVGKSFKVDEFTITPAISIQYINLRLDGYQEEGAGASNQIVALQSYNSLYNGLTAKVVKEPYNVKGLKITPEIHAGYHYEALNETQSVNAKFTGGGSFFETKGANPDNHSYNIGTGVTLVTQGDLSITTSYDFSMKQAYKSHAGFVSGRFRF